MNRVIILESLLALAAVAVLGPGSSLLVGQAARQALALVKIRRRRTLRQAANHPTSPFAAMQPTL